MRRSACLLSLLWAACALPEDGNLTPRCALDVHCPAAMRCYRSYCVEDEDAATTELPPVHQGPDAGAVDAAQTAERPRGESVVATDAGVAAADVPVVHVEPPSPPPPHAAPAAPPEPQEPRDAPAPPKPGGPAGPGPRGGPPGGPAKGPPAPPR